MHRRPLVAFAAAAIIGCAGGDSAGPGESPGPTGPVVGPPAVIRVNAGDEQRADPGAAVAVAPSVLVTDAANRPIAGATVQFVVDSGGGEVTQPSATTGPDGIASAGTWRLGTVEGTSQILRATVGALPAVRFRALAQVATTTLADVALPANGTPVIFRRAGLPGDSVILSAPDGALGTATRVSLRVGSAQAVVLPPGWRAVSPSVQVLPSNGAHLAPVTIAVPGDLSGPDPVLLIAWDESTGRIAVLPTIGRSDRMIAALVSPAPALTWYTPPGIRPAARGSGQHMTASWSTLLRGAWSAVRSGEDPSAVPPVILMIRIDRSTLSTPFDTGFRPERDAWPFDDIISVLAPPFEGAGLAPREAFVAPAVTSIWYFLNQRGSEPLRTRFTEAKDVVLSVRLGLKWNSIVEQLLPAASLPRVMRLRESPIALPQNALEQYWGVVALFGLSRNAPQPVALLDTESATDGTIAKVGIAFRVQVPVAGSGELLLDVAVPGSNEGVVTMRARAEGWVPVTVTYGASRKPVTFNGLNVLPAGGGFADAVLAITWPLVETKLLGISSSWPQLRLTSAYGDLDPSDVVLLDDLQHWWECDNCPATTYRQTAVVPHPVRLRPFARYSLADNVWTARELFAPSLRFSGASLPSATAAVVAGMAVWQPGDEPGSEIQSASWIDWRTVTYRRMPTSITPAGEVTASRDTTITFVVTPQQPPSGTLRFRWTVRGANGAADDSVDTDVPTWSKAFPVGADRSVIVTVLHGANKRPIGRDSMRVKVGELRWAAWRLTSLSVSTPIDMRRDSTICLTCSGVPSDTMNVWAFYQLRAGLGSAFHRDMIDRVRDDSLALSQLAQRPDTMMLVYLDTALVSLVAANNTQAFLVQPGLYLRPGRTLPAPDRSEAPYGLAPAQGSPGQLAYSQWFGGNVSCVDDHARRFARTGNPLQSGTVTSVVWVRSWAVADGPGGPRPEPLWLVRTSFTSNGNTASGTYTLVYVLANTCGILGSGSVNQKRNLLLTREVHFTAERLR